MTFRTAIETDANQPKSRNLRIWQGILVGVAAFSLSGCVQNPNGGFGLAMPGFGASQQAQATAQPRPAPDQRGVISFPSFQVVVAQAGETARSIGTRLGINGGQLAQHNAIDGNTQLRKGEVLTLPGGKGGSVQVTDPFAGQGVKKRGQLDPQPTSAAPSQGSATTANPQQHRVVAGETAWSISRKYGVSIQDLASWNGLPGDMTIRTGQLLTIPVGSNTATGAQKVTAPGSGSPTPRPPSSATPLPDEATQPASKTAAPAQGPDLGATRTAASSRGHFAMPTSGPIARAYKKGSNDGIDIKAEPGSPVKAAASGTVAAITRDTNGVPIVVIRHQGDLMTVYTRLDNLTVSKGDTVTAGQSIGKADPNGLVHFEIRKGYESVDPADYL